MANENFSKEDSEEELYVPLKLKRGLKTKKMVTRNFKDVEDEDFWKEDSEEQLSVPLKSKRRVKTKKMEYDGWGSKPLIEFLKEIGVETENKISQWDLTTIVNEYVAKKKLNSQVKKNRVICDNWLRYLFGKKFVLRIKIHELLYPHLAENRDESEDEDSNNSEEEEENKTAASRKRKALCLNSKKLPETPTSCFASIIPENIKLVYLRRSLIEELLKDPDTFESKVVGSYVRIKCDPNDCSQKNSHQLLQVTGVRKAPECGDGGAEYFLEATHFFKEIPFSELSNDHFKKEECDDLRQRIITGSFRRPTVMEFQQKAQILHKFITKQWISRELTLLQNQIEHANIKGWRRELHEYLERKELLQKPAEQERLLLEVPNVIAEPLEPEVIVHEPAEDENTDKCCLPQSTIAGISEDVPFNTEEDKSLSNDYSCSTDAAASADVDGKGNRTCRNDTKFAKEANCVLGVTKVQKLDINIEDEPDTSPQQTKEISSAMNLTIKLEPQVISIEEDTKSLIDLTCIGNHKLDSSTEDKGPQLIELSDDDEEVDSNDTPQRVDDPESKLWYYKDPHEITQGPFSITKLKSWKAQNYFPPGFQVWKEGQSPVLLESIISL